MDEQLAGEYGWLPWQSDEFEWTNVLKFVDAVNKKNEDRQKEKIEDYIMLLHIIHSSAPDKFVSQLRGMLTGEQYNDELGNMKKLIALKENMKGVRSNGN